MDMFEDEFNDKELKNNLVENHMLYQLLKKYSKSRAKLKLNLLNLNQYKKKCNLQYKKIWRIEHKKAYGNGFCKCGSAVRGHHDYEYVNLYSNLYHLLIFFWLFLDTQFLTKKFWGNWIEVLKNYFNCRALITPKAVMIRSYIKCK